MILPLVATGVYYYLAISISKLFYSLSFKLSLTIKASAFDNLRFSIKSTLSNIIPFEVANNSNIRSSFLFKFILPLAIYYINSYLVYSISGISRLTTSPSNYSSKPYSVTVKLITVTLINISGK